MKKHSVNYLLKEQNELREQLKDAKVAYDKLGNALDNEFKIRFEAESLNSQLLHALNHVRTHGLIKKEGYEFVVNLLTAAISNAQASRPYLFPKFS